MNAEATPPYSIVVPVYNEAASIEGIVRELKALPGPPPEIILVDDGSIDGTSEVLDSLAAKDPALRVIRHSLNRGYGAAIKSGVLAAASSLIAITDADGTYPAAAIPSLVAAMSVHDMVVGARTGGRVEIPLIRRPAKWMLGRLANYLSGMKIPDLNSGLRVMRKDAITRFLNILPDGFSFTTTITLAMLTNGYKVQYLPVDYYMREGKSKIRPIRDTLNFLQLIVRTTMYFDPLKVFLPVSSMLFIASIGVFTFSYFFLERVLDTTSTILFVGGIQMLAIGMLADLIDKRSKG